MAKIYVGNNGDYWFVDSYTNIFTVRAIVSRQEMESCKGIGFLPQMKINQIIKKEKDDGKLLDDFDILVYDDEDVELGYQRTVIFARRHHFRYVTVDSK